MGKLRLVAAVVALGTLWSICFGACRASQADTGSGLTPPQGWRALPTLAQAARDAAKRATLAVDGAEAWGEPSRGCYAAWIALRGTGAVPEAMAQQLVTGLSADPSLIGIVIRDVEKPAAGAQSGVLALKFQRALYSGRLRASLGSNGAIAALACFWNQREPVACEQACIELAGSVR
jgi:hypothetical protein